MCAATSMTSRGSMVTMLNSRRFLMSLSLFALACGAGTTEADSAEDADESVSVTSVESALTAEVSDEVAQPQSATADALATSAAGRVPTHFTPSGCAVAVQAGTKVTYTLTNCTGRYGLVSVSGTVVATYSRANGGAVKVVVTSTGLKANEATLDVNATVLASQTGTTKTAEVTSSASGTGSRGVTLTRNGTYPVTYDLETECITVNGSWKTGVGTRDSTTTVSNYARCKGACATSGSIVHEAVRGPIVTIAYSGASTAAWSTSGGRSGSLDLRCSK